MRISTEKIKWIIKSTVDKNKILDFERLRVLVAVLKFDIIKSNIKKYY